MTWFLRIAYPKRRVKGLQKPQGSITEIVNDDEFNVQRRVDSLGNVYIYVLDRTTRRYLCRKFLIENTPDQGLEDLTIARLKYYLIRDRTL